MPNKLNTIDWIALILAIIGGLNWGLVGLFDLNVVSAIFASVPVIATIIYVLVGISALYLLIVSGKLARK